jgi:zona occludens toxin (predicted ATPase)
MEDPGGSDSRKQQCEETSRTIELQSMGLKGSKKTSHNPCYMSSKLLERRRKNLREEVFSMQKRTTGNRD